MNPSQKALSLNRATSRKQNPSITVWALRLLPLLMVLLLPVTGQAQFNYTTNNGVITITGYTGPGGVVTIPDTINGLQVVSIGNGGLSGKTTLTSVTIPNSVTSIGNYAFSYCGSLASVTIGNSVTSIGYEAFSYCTSLTGVYFEGNAPTTVGPSVFLNANNPTVYYLLGTTGWGATFAGRPAALWNPAVPFTYTTSAGTITITGYTGTGGTVIIPSTIDGLPVTAIRDKAFSYKNSLTSVTIGNSVTSIGEWAFQACDSLASVTIGNSVTNIGNYAFFFCTRLTSVTIPNSVTRIGIDAFFYCTSLTSVTIPTSVTRIGESAFSGCGSLTSVTIPNSVTSIGNYAFNFCPSLASITVDAANPNYSSDVAGVLFNKTQTTLIQCPGAKAGSFTIPNSVTSIGNNAFYSCSSLTSVTIPSSVTSIGYEVFRSCTSLASITVDAANPNYSSDVTGVLFNKTQTTLIQCPGGKAGSYTIPDSVTRIEIYAFDYCSSLTSVTIPDSVTSVGNSAFSGCGSLASVTIPNSVTSLGDSAFRSCSSLTSVTIGNSVTSIGDSAFYSCSSLTSVYFEGNAPTSVGTSVFLSANNATVYYMSGTTGWGAAFAGRPAVLWDPTAAFTYTTNAGQITITGYTGPGGAVIIPATISGLPVTTIGDLAFDSKINLTSVTIPNSVTSIGDYAFSDCTSLTAVYFQGNAPPDVGSDIFDNATNAIVYYLAGTAGWGATFAGRPTMLLEPPQEPPSLFQWAKRIASTINSDTELSTGMALDSLGNVYVTGWFDGTNDFGGVNLTNKSGGGQDIFVAKYDSAGALQWARRAGGSSSDRDGGRGVGVDSTGNAYVTGEFLGTADFGGFTLTASQNKEFFLAKYDSAGAIQWARQSTGGTSSGVYGTGLAVDGAGNSYAVGFADNGGTITFGTTSLPSPSATGYSTFLVKYDNSGTVQWAQLMGGPDHTYATKVALDDDGNVYVRGAFIETMSIGTSNLVSSGSSDMFIAKFNNSGVLIWVRQSAGAYVDEGGVAVDEAGNVYVTGSFEDDPIDFGAITLTNAGTLDAFVAKYDSAGTIQWARRAGGTGFDFYWDVALDQQGNVYVAGVLGSDAVAPAGSGGAMIAKYDPTGTLQWAYSASGPPADPVPSIGTKVAVDAGGNAFLAGWYQTTTTFGTNVLSPDGFWNFFLTRVGFTPFTLEIEWISDQPQLSVFGEIGNRYALEYVPALPASNNWQGLITNTLMSNPFIFLDSGRGGSTSRFYRARPVP